jgi:N-acetylneuraminic acid mutarotase
VTAASIGSRALRSVTVAAILLAVAAGGLRTQAATAGAPGRWTPRTPLPVALQDAGGAAVGGRLYVVGGKTEAGHQSALYVYNPRARTWRNLGRPLPGPAVENPAVAAFAGKLYVFGGSTSAFKGAVRNAAVYNPVTRKWRSVRAMPAALGGATAKAIGRRIYVAGGMTPGGASVASLYAYIPRTNSWRSLRGMRTRRDNPGSAVLRDRTGNPKLYVFGGRTRNATDELNGTLASVEMYNPVTNRWVARTPMPTGRRAMVVGTLNGRAQVMGGERKPGGTGVFSENEEYMPRTNSWRPLAPMSIPRHGAVAATIGRVVYVAGGGVNAGSSFTERNEAFSL